MSSNPVYSFFATPASVAPLFLRMAVAAVFFYHGVQKTLGWFGGKGWSDTIGYWTNADNYGLPYIVAVFLLAGELLLFLAMFFGFLTRLAAVIVVITISWILIFVQDVTTFDSIEFSVLLIAIGVSLMITGAGSFSMDRAISVNLLPQVG